MKKLSIIVATCFIMAISFSCADSFLDKKPLGSTSEDVFYSEKGVTALLTGAYSMVKGSALWTVSWGASITNWTFKHWDGCKPLQHCTECDCQDSFPCSSYSYTIQS
ncbi:MAG: hypothetical protein NTZ69_18415 [Bacteroidia bacterium]|nr:hypothetical protein [Bacteroidia bacterium]